jgi:hypothetical protein
VIDVNICGAREVGRLGRKPVLNVEALIGIHHVENQEFRTSIETKRNPVRYVIITKPILFSIFIERIRLNSYAYFLMFEN